MSQYFRLAFLLTLILSVGAGFAREAVNPPAPFMDRERTLAVFEENVFGRRPDLSRFERTQEVLKTDRLSRFKAVRKAVRLSTLTPRGVTNFTCAAFIPDATKPVPVFVLVSLRPINQALQLPDDPARWPIDDKEFLRVPITNVLARGYAVCMFWHNDVFPDNKSSFAGVTRQPDGWGALSTWAFAASRVLDWIETEPMLDASKAAVIGHSRGGKTALWAGATDTRFAMAISNGSGNSGARYHGIDIPRAEKIADIVYSFPYWFAPNYATRWRGKDLSLPFDNHQLIALMAPRCVAVGSGVEDYWAGPQGEELATRLASRAWEDPLKVHYHCRPGVHSLTSEDWTQYMDFCDARGWTK